MRPCRPGSTCSTCIPYKFVNGEPADYRSQRKGPFGGPRPIGSRFGPQNMVVCGWALQALRADPDLWETAQSRIRKPNYFPQAGTEDVIAGLERELAGGLRTWEAIFDAKGYIPTGLGAGNCGAGFPWDELSDTGGYAHLISAASQWLLYLEGKNDWDVHQVRPPGLRHRLRRPGCSWNERTDSVNARTSPSDYASTATFIGPAVRSVAATSPGHVPLAAAER